MREIFTRPGRTFTGQRLFPFVFDAWAFGLAGAKAYSPLCIL
jgi:hypothetical protein